MFQKNYVHRRQAPRFDASAIPSLRSVYLDGGPRVKLINISRVGALIEIQERMLPGSRVTLKFVTAEMIHFVEGRIVRCSVDSIDKVCSCQCAIAFDKDFTILPPVKEI